MDRTAKSLSIFVAALYCNLNYKTYLEFRNYKYRIISIAFRMHSELLFILKFKMTFR